MTDLPPLGPKGGKGVGMKGLVVVDTYRGQIRTRAWPKKRGPKKTANQQAVVDRFTKAMELIKRLEPGYWAYAYEVTKGSPFMPRDFMLMALTGRYAMFVDPQGKKIYPFAYMADVSEALDSIGQEPGSILIRGEDFWIVIPAGLPGQILSFEDFPAGPTWIDQEIADPQPYVGDIEPFVGGTALAFDNQYMRMIINPYATIVTGVEAWHNGTNATCKIIPILYSFRLADGQAGNLLAKGPQVTGYTPGRNVYNFDAPIALAANTIYWFGLFPKVSNMTMLGSIIHGSTKFGNGGAAPLAVGPSFAFNSQDTWTTFRLIKQPH